MIEWETDSDKTNKRIECLAPFIDTAYWNCKLIFEEASKFENEIGSFLYVQHLEAGPNFIDTINLQLNLAITFLFA
jgi:hypothetical protein